MFQYKIKLTNDFSYINYFEMCCFKKYLFNTLNVLYNFLLRLNRDENNKRRNPYLTSNVILLKNTSSVV